MADKYTTLVRFILWNHDLLTAIAEKNDGGSEFTQARIDVYDELLRWTQGFEGVDRDGLRERFKEA